MLSIVNTIDVTVRARTHRQHNHYNKQIIPSENKTYSYNPYMNNKNRDAFRSVCKMSGTDQLVDDIKRLTTIVSSTVKKLSTESTELFSKIVSGPILQIPSKIKTIIKKIGYRPRMIAINPRTNSRSSSIGRLLGKCDCGDYFRIIISDRLHKIAVCSCGMMKG